MPWEDGSIGEITDAWKDRLQQSFEKYLFFQEETMRLKLERRDAEARINAIDRLM